MASTYNYKTGRMEFDFVLREDGGVCHRISKDFPLPPTRIGNDVCRRCCYHSGSRFDMTEFPTKFFTMCKQPGATDTGTDNAWYSLREELLHDALCALDC